MQLLAEENIEAIEMIFVVNGVFHVRLACPSDTQVVGCQIPQQLTPTQKITSTVVRNKFASVK